MLFWTMILLLYVMIGLLIVWLTGWMKSVPCRDTLRFMLIWPIGLLWSIWQVITKRN